jgi:hypothetical protein
MSDKSNEYMQKHEHAKIDYDKLAHEMNKVMHAIDNAYSADEKKLLQKKRDSIADKMPDADRKEKEAKRQLDIYMSNRR